MATLHASGSDRLDVAGDLLFSDAVRTRDLGRDLIAGLPAGRITVSLAAVGRVNSVSAVVLLDWQRAATAAGKTLRVVDVPPRLAGILRLCGLEDLLPAA